MYPIIQSVNFAHLSISVKIKTEMTLDIVEYRVHIGKHIIQAVEILDKSNINNLGDGCRWAAEFKRIFRCSTNDLVDITGFLNQICHMAI